MKKFDVKEIVEIAMLIALAIILDKFVKISIGATGGSINIATIPLIIIALRHDFLKSFISIGIIFGFISCLLDGYGLQTYPFEYLLAFGSISIISLFNKYINANLKSYKSYILLTLLIILFTIIRILCATIDSIIIYEYEFIPAITYNISYILPSSIIVLIIMILLSRFVLIYLNEKYKVSC